MRTILILLLASSVQAVSYRQISSSTKTIQRVDDQAIIPLDPKNRDYQDFLLWQKAGNAILPPEPIKPEDAAIRQIYEKAITDAADARKTVAERIDALLVIIGIPKQSTTVGVSTR